MALAICPPRKGSSPLPSAMRPQRGSRAMSTIGLNVQQMPLALASMAAIRADCSIADMFQVAAKPKGMGKVVSYPWMTSIPNRSGICRRLSSTATRCTSRILSTPFMLNNPPTLPCLILVAMSLLLASPVMMSPELGKFSCPNFSSNVIFNIKLSINFFISTF